MRLRKLEKRMRERARQSRGDRKARTDPTDLRTLREKNRSPQNMSRTDVRKHWERLCHRSRRKIPVPKSGLLPILEEKDRKVRDAGIKWYCGSFPGNPDPLKAALPIEEYRRHMARIQTGMLSDTWGSGVRSRTVESISALVTILEGCFPRGKKRERSEAGPSNRLCKIRSTKQNHLSIANRT